MFLVLVALTSVALCQAEPDKITGKTILADAPRQPVFGRNDGCPADYFSAYVPLKALTFERGRDVVRRYSNLSNLDQVQCGPFPDTVHCELTLGVVLCASGDPSQPLMPKVEFVFDCEAAPSDETCFLEGSCFLRCDSGTDDVVVSEPYVCPPDYFSAYGPSKTLIFERGRNVVRRYPTLSNLDQVQCAPFPNMVHCELTQGIILCISGDPSQPLLPKVEFRLDCEAAPIDETCFLEGSCFLRCDSGTDDVVVSESDVCPPGYTFLPNTRGFSFTKGAKATRNRIPLENSEALRCENSTQCEDLASLPDTVECQMKAVKNGFDWSCFAPNNSAVAVTNTVVLCESADSDPSCILNDSCVLRYQVQGLETWKIIAIVVGVALAAGLIGLSVAFALRRR